ncbi:hypothetical protein NCAS_0G00130 [Naumovozyma castellii]|uniref:Suppressor of lethality of KEX2 GAS1 double null mutant protein 1 n=1 Tax=Naumovozyma castellii TaxID=27288 RepID=G0VHL6_NAUCA|nr:hypothetical protein NCAS_0G00130 [Naumovozyma castellii CBS 4309]CCC70900.1 hypothetical protein NCAS_0G00130 [Naumovozyma castellii CBS 4309]
MSSLSVAVGCAVGIPIAVAFLIALVFWGRLQRRFTNEYERDRDLENAINNDDILINFDVYQSLQDLSSTLSDPTILKKETRNTENEVTGSSDDEVIENSKPIALVQNPSNDKRKYFIPAYRRNINSLQASNEHTPQVSCQSSLNVPVNDSLLNVYDQMIPFVDNIPSGADAQKQKGVSKSTNRDKNSLLKNINSQDFGSFYPGRESSSNLYKCNFPKVPTETSISEKHMFTRISNTLQQKVNASPLHFSLIDDGSSDIEINNVDRS